MAIANWMCSECYVVLEAENEGQTEYCPRCDRVMDEAFLEEET